MRGPLAWMIQNPIAANLLMLVLIIGGVFTAPAVAHRRAMDAFVAAEIQRHSRASGPAANGPATNASIAGVAGERTERAARVGADTEEGDEPRTFAEKMRLKRRLAAANKH